MTTKNSKNGATTLSRVNFSEYVGLFSRVLTTVHCLVGALGFGLDSVSGR